MKGVKNNPKRSGFDLSKKVAFTAKVGELLPVLTQEVIPGDKFEINLQHFTRTQPVNTAAYTRVREYYDAFFVPYRLLWRYAPQFFTGMGNNVQQSTSLKAKEVVGDRLPYISGRSLSYYIGQCSTDPNSEHENNLNQFGYNRAILSCKLLQYLGYGDLYRFVGLSDIDSPYAIRLNPFPLLAYQKIYQDYFRNSQWESSNPTTYNIDWCGTDEELGINSLHDSGLMNVDSNLLDLRYCNWNKDYFMGLLPRSQYGSEAYIPYTSDVPFEDLENTSLFRPQATNPGDDPQPVSFVPDDYGGTIGSFFTSDVYGQLNMYADRNWLDSLQRAVAVKMSVLALRQAECLQKFKEIQLSGDQSYKDQIEKVFGVKVPSGLSNMCQWIGGSSSNLDISEVVNTNITAENASDIAGKGVGSGTGHIQFEAKEHGVFMVIYHSVPLLDFDTQGISKFVMKNNFSDFANPVFDSIGMQQVSAMELDSAYASSEAYPEGFNYSLGYAPRYIDYKTNYDTVLGGFSSNGTLKNWVAPISSDYIQDYLDGVKGSLDFKINYNFFKCNPSVLNPIFGVAADEKVDTDQLLINCFFDFKAVRNLDYDGLPY